jgi:hypothetical protein
MTDWPGTPVQTATPAPSWPGTPLPSRESTKFEPHTAFTNQMNETFGEGKWRTTGGYRSPERENQLRDQGAQTVAPGRTSRHSMGSPDAPGAYDIVVDGMSPQAAAAVMKQKGLAMPTFPEGSAGGQGAHLHVGAAKATDPKEWPGQAAGQKPQAWPGQPAKPTAQARPATPAAPAAKTQGWPGKLISDTFGPEMSQIGKDFKDLGSGSANPLDFRGLKAALSLPGDAIALAAAPLQRASDAVKKATGWRGQQGIDLMQASMAALPGEGAAAGAARAVKGVGDAAGGALKTAEKILSPATVDDEAKATALIHRKAFGTRGTDADAEAHALSRHQRTVGNASPEDQRKVIAYVEGRSTGAQIEPKYQKAADGIRDMAQRYRKRIETVLGDGENGDGPTFVRDYYSRMWKQNPKEVEAKVPWGSPKQGSGRSLKARSLPTYEDGLAAGLTPKYENPIDAMTAYSDNMGRFLATHDVQNEMKATGLAKMVPEGQIPEGWVKLNGVRSEEAPRPFMRSDGKPGITSKKVLAAPEGAARVYNNHISKGLDQGDIGPVYRGARAAVNGMVQLKLGLSTFHAATMGEEGFVSEVAKGLGQASRGKVLEGAKTLAASPAAPIKTAMRGESLRGELLGYRLPTEMGSKIADAYRRAGGRVYMDRMYSAHGSGSFWSSMKRGTLQRDAGDAVKKLYTGSMGERAKGIVDLTGNLIRSTAAPIFEEYVPRMKMGAFSSRMESFLKENPNATQAELDRYGAKLADTIDNRFGELQTDNLFWHKSAYQLAQLMLLSPSWDVGTVREIGGGVIEIPKSLAGIVKGKGVTDKTAYVAALVGTTMLQNGVMTKLHTGQNPEGEDFFAYRTGGKDQNGQDERAIIPGYMKDVLAFGWQFPSNVTKEISNKANPGLKTAGEVLGNKDWRGDPIMRPAGVEPQGPDDNRLAELATYMAKQMVPISMSGKANPDSKIGPLERAAAVKQAPSYLEDPDRVRGNEAKYGGRDWKRKLKHDAKDAAQ